VKHHNTKPTCTYILGIHDIDYQNSSDTVGSSWHGFSDRDAGITHYMWCVQTQSSNQPCDVRDWENIGIHRSVSRTKKLWSGQALLRRSRRSGSGRKNQTKTICLPSFEGET
jgi:hypothetical protein